MFLNIRFVVIITYTKLNRCSKSIMLQREAPLLKRHRGSDLLALRTLVILMRILNWIEAAGIQHFVNRNY